MSSSDCKLHILEGEEDKVRNLTHSSLVVDANYLDLDSLIRLYGSDAVMAYIKSQSRS